MAKVQIISRDGTKITIEGNATEVAALSAQLKFGISPRRLTQHQPINKRKSKLKATPINLIAELIDGGFFKKPKVLSAVKLALDEQGHFYPATSLSPALLRLVRNRHLRRIKDKKRWLYVN
jgi:hypothetical protein